MVAINFPLPSGSSPPEKPPGKAMMFARPIAAAIAFTLSSISEAERFLTTTISGSAPARRNYRAVSSSQFVPGKTGINTRGFAAFVEIFSYFFSAVKSQPSAFPSASAVVAKTLSRGDR